MSEPILFFSEAWMKWLVDTLNDDAEYQRLAETYEGDMIFQCNAAPGVHELLENDIRYYFDPHHGRIRSWRLLQPGEECASKYECVADYKNWKQIAQGKLGLKKAVLVTQKIKIKGNMVKLLKHLKSSERVFDIMKEKQDQYQFLD
jgi:putative sterol carrier protein